MPDTLLIGLSIVAVVALVLRWMWRKAAQVHSYLFDE